MKTVFVGDEHLPTHYVTGMPVHVSLPDVTAIVKQPFYVLVRLVGNGYIASSSISNSYEIGETPGKAIGKFVQSGSAFSSEVCYTRWRCIWTFIIALAAIFIIHPVQEVWPSITQVGDDS